MTSIVKELTYYCRDENRKPVVTVVLLVDSEGNVARGYAVCSDLETPVINPNVPMRNGPGLARKRAVKVYKMAMEPTNKFPVVTRKNRFPIERSEPIDILARVSGGNDLLAISEHCKGSFVSHEISSELCLTKYERKLLKSNGFM